MQIRDRTATGLIPNQGCRYCEDNDIDRYKLNFDLQSDQMRPYVEIALSK